MLLALATMLNPKECFFALPDGDMFAFVHFHHGFINIPADKLFNVLAGHGKIVVHVNGLMVPELHKN